MSFKHAFFSLPGNTRSARWVLAIEILGILALFLIPAHEESEATAAQAAEQPTTQVAPQRQR